jgi:hypothetical protein
LHFGDRVAVLNVFLYQTGGSTLGEAYPHWLQAGPALEEGQEGQAAWAPNPRGPAPTYTTHSVHVGTCM